MRSPESTPIPGSKTSFDWMQGRAVLINESSYSTGKLILEKTEDERNAWAKCEDRVKKSEQEYQKQGVGGDIAQSMALLNDPTLGPLLSMWATKEQEYLEREKVTYLHDLAATRKLLAEARPEQVKQEMMGMKRHRAFVRMVGKKILAGQLLSPQDYQPKRYSQLELGLETTDQVASEMWHHMIQLPNGQEVLKGFLPYTVNLTQEEADRAISAFYEDAIAKGGFYGQRKQLRQEGSSSPG